MPGPTSIYRALVRHRLVEVEQRRRRRADYRRWERGRPMELWQMDVVGGFHLVDGTEWKAVSGIDDNSRFVVPAMLVRRATAGPVCQALLAALRRHGCPVFTGRFGPAGSSAEVLFDRICAENGIRHLLTAPRSPTTTGKVERWYKTMRAEFLADHDRRHATVEELQAAFDAWVAHYDRQLAERPSETVVASGSWTHLLDPSQAGPRPGIHDRDSRTSADRGQCPVQKRRTALLSWVRTVERGQVV